MRKTTFAEQKPTGLSAQAASVQLIQVVLDQITGLVLRLRPNVNKLLIGRHGEQRVVASIAHKTNQTQKRETNTGLAPSYNILVLNLVCQLKYGSADSKHIRLDCHSDLSAAEYLL